MSYTHYFYRPERITPDRFAATARDVTRILEALSARGVPLAGPLATGAPEITSEEIAFNGKHDCGHAALLRERGERQVVILGRECPGHCNREAFRLPRVLPPVSEPALGPCGPQGLWFGCCATGFHPYDIAVTASLLVAKHHLGEQFEFRSDGKEPEWQAGRELCQELFGYGWEAPLSDDEGPSSPLP